MANQYKEYVDALWFNYAYAGGDFNDAETDISLAWVQWGQPDDHEAIQKTLWAVQHILDGVRCIIGQGDPPANINYLDKALFTAWQYTIEDLPVVTWKSIVEAWMKDDYAGREWTIAVIDRMRQILWNDPFNIMFAARPEDKEIET